MPTRQKSQAERKANNVRRVQKAREKKKRAQARSPSPPLDPPAHSTPAIDQPPAETLDSSDDAAEPPTPSLSPQKPHCGGPPTTPLVSRLLEVRLSPPPISSIGGGEKRPRFDSSDGETQPNTDVGGVQTPSTSRIRGRERLRRSTRTQRSYKPSRQPTESVKDEHGSPTSTAVNNSPSTQLQWECLASLPFHEQTYRDPIRMDSSDEGPFHPSSMDETSSSSSAASSPSAFQSRTRSRRIPSKIPKTDAEPVDWLAHASMILSQSWAAHCNHVHDLPALEGTEHTMAEMSGYWRDLVPEHAPSDRHVPPIFESGRLMNQEESEQLCARGIWERLLAGSNGGDTGPSLSLARCEDQFLQSDDARQLKIGRDWGVDSFLARVTTLAVHKTAFTLSMRPAYLQAITSNPHVRFRGEAIHTLKQIRLGSGLRSQGFGFHCHVFFPHMPRRRVRPASEARVNAGGRPDVDLTVHLSDEEQAGWMDDIMFPAIEEVCGASTKHHYPRTFADARAKARVKREKSSTVGVGADINVSYPIPEKDLQEVWAAVLRRTTGDTATAPPAYRDPFLVISGHDLKLYMVSDTPQKARDKFLGELDVMFHYNDDWFPPADQWLDFGHEDTPCDGAAVGITLLRKTPCLRSWADGFRCPTAPAARTRVRHWPWAMTRDAGSTAVELLSQNTLRREGKMALSKAYNVFKNLYSTPLKGYGPFDNHQFEALAFSDTLLVDWYQLSKISIQDGKSFRQRLIKSYLLTKERLGIAFTAMGTATPIKNVGVRKEDRINIELLRALPLDDRKHRWGVPDAEQAMSTAVKIVAQTQESDEKVWVMDDTAAAHSIAHRPFWILPTTSTIEFAASETGRWLLCLEAMIALVAPTSPPLSPSSPEQQLSYGTVVSTLLRSLRLTVVGEYPPKMRALWKESVKQRKVRLPNSDDSSEGEAKAKKGLGYQQCLERRGMMWLPPKLFTWDPIPTFTRRIRRHLAIGQNSLQQSFKKTAGVQGKLQRWTRVHRKFRENLQEIESGSSSARHEALCIGAELLVQALIQDIFRLLATRHFDSSSVTDNELETFLRLLTSDEASGLCGLTSVMLQTIIGAEPYLAFASNPNRRSTRQVTHHFIDYNTGRWADKVAAFFTWENDGLVKSRATWANFPFRTLTRRLRNIAAVELGDDAESEMMECLKITAARHIFICPLYNSETLSTLRKSHPSSSLSTRQEIAQSSALQRTLWLVPRLDADLHMTMVEAEVESDDEEYKGSCRDRIVSALLQPGLRVLGNGNRAKSDAGSTDTGIPRDPARYGLDLTLHRAADFHRRIEAEDDQSSDGGDSNNDVELPSL